MRLNQSWTCGGNDTAVLRVASGFAIRLVALVLLYNAKFTGETYVAKERRPNKEARKKPAMTPKERKAAKKARKGGTKSLLG
jgi:hypothetical protein